MLGNLKSLQEQPETGHNESKSHQGQACSDPCEQRTFGGEIIAQASSLPRFSWGVHVCAVPCLLISMLSRFLSGDTRIAEAPRAIVPRTSRCESGRCSELRQPSSPQRCGRDPSSRSNLEKPSCAIRTRRSRSACLHLAHQGSDRAKLGYCTRTARRFGLAGLLTTHDIGLA